MGYFRGVIRTALAAAVAIALAACASTSLKHGKAPDSLGASGAQNSSAVARPPPGPREIIVDRAKSMLGQPYRWGGDAPGGFDCSGLVVYAATGAGIRVPRTAHEQRLIRDAIAQDRYAFALDEQLKFGRCEQQRNAADRAQRFQTAERDEVGVPRAQTHDADQRAQTAFEALVARALPAGARRKTRLL